MATSVVLEKVVKRYGAVPVIHGIDLTIDPGEFAVFVGPSGCGKSTLLRMIAGLEEISGGALLLDGERMNEVPRRPSAASPWSSSPTRSTRTCRSTRTSPSGSRPPASSAPRSSRGCAAPPRSCASSRCSTASPRRSQAASASASRSAAPSCASRGSSSSTSRSRTSTPSLRVQMRVEIARLHRDLGNTMIYVTHDQVEAMTMADKIVVLNGGPHRAGRRAARALQPPGQPLRRRLHRQPEDELPRRPHRGARGRRHRDRASAARPCGCRGRCAARRRARRSRSGCGPST